jgi:hypothetical protein
VAGERTQLANPGLIGRQCNCVVGVGVEDDAGGRQRVDGTTADVSSRAHPGGCEVICGRTVARFDLPDGYLAFASHKRLVLSVPAPYSPNDFDFPLEEWSGPFGLALYSTWGRRIAGLGSAERLPLVSGMHLLAEELDTDTVSVRSVTGGAPQPVVGFNEARERLALAFRWPALVVVEATRAPLLPSEVHCWSGEYGAAGPPFLGVFDLAGGAPFVPAPTLVHVQPSQPLTNCGPPPP